MELVYQKSDLQFPPLGLTFTMREHFIRISCPILIANRTGKSFQNKIFINITNDYNYKKDKTNNKV